MEASTSGAAAKDEEEEEGEAAEHLLYDDIDAEVQRLSEFNKHKSGQNACSSDHKGQEEGADSNSVLDSKEGEGDDDDLAMLYDDIDTSGAEMRLQELRDEETRLRGRNDDLIASYKRAKARRDELKAKNQKLLENISIIFSTAKVELARRERELNELEKTTSKPRRR